MGWTTRHVWVIGAGPAGLAVAHELQRRRIDVGVVEQAGAVGASWRARHEDLRLNTSRWFSNLPGSPMPRRYGWWVRRDDYVAYLDRYALAKRLDIYLDTFVRAVRREPSGWLAATERGDLRSTHVIIATGHDRVLVTPE